MASVESFTFRFPGAGSLKTAPPATTSLHSSERSTPSLGVAESPESEPRISILEEEPVRRTDVRPRKKAK